MALNRYFNRAQIFMTLFSKIHFRSILPACCSIISLDVFPPGKFFDSWSQTEYPYWVFSWVFLSLHFLILSAFIIPFLLVRHRLNSVAVKGFVNNLSIISRQLLGFFNWRLSECCRAKIVYMCGGPGSNTGLVMWDFVMDKSCAGAGFLRELRFPLPIDIPSAFPQSSSLSPEAGTIGQEWPQCQ
jgi:hypothetical protein